MEVLITLIAIALVLLLYQWKKNLARMKMLTADIPGPESYPFFGFALSLATSSDDIIADLTQLSKKYGNIFKFWWGPKLFIITTSPDDFRDILSSDKFINKPFTKFFAPFVGTKSLFVAKDEQWKRRRKVAVRSFRFKMINEFIECFNSKSKLLVENMRTEVGKSGFNVCKYLDPCIIEIVAETTMGLGIGEQYDKNYNLALKIHEMESIMVYRITRLWAYSNFIFNVSPAGRRQTILFQELYEIIKQKLYERREEWIKRIQSTTSNEKMRKNSTDERVSQLLMDDLFDYNENGTEQLSDEDIAHEIITVLVAGTTSTAATVSLAINAIMNRQDIQDKIYNELNDIFNGSDRNATMQDVQNMQYLERVLKETLRLWPAAFSIFRTISEDFKLKSGYTLPAGCNVILFINELHRNPDIYPNPDIFDPERFNEENSLGRHQYAFCPFVAGPRKCIGEKYAMSTMKIILSQILRNYKILTPTVECPKVKIVSEMVTHSKTGIHVKLETR